MKRSTVIVIALVAFFGLSRNINAGTILTLTAGATTVSCDSGIGGCGAAFTISGGGNIVGFTGSVGPNWTVSAATNTSNVPGTSFGSLSLAVNSASFTGATGTGLLVVSFAGYDYTSPPPSQASLMTLDASQSATFLTSTSGDHVNLVAHADPNNVKNSVTPFESIPPQITSSGANNNSGSADGPTVFWNRLATNYSLHGLQNITCAAATTPCSVNTTATLSVFAVPTPEPSSMLLFGAGLIGLAAWGRKRIKKK